MGYTRWEVLVTGYYLYMGTKIVDTHLICVRVTGLVFANVLMKEDKW